MATVRAMVCGFLAAVLVSGVAWGGNPNVLFIAIDDLRPELGCYGAPQVKSPHLDRLAATAVRFDRAYCMVPTCGASRASLMTGVLPTRGRFKSYLTKASEDAPWAATLPEVFKKAGYTTLSNGKIFHHPDDTAGRSWSEPAWRPRQASLKGLDPETMAKLSKRGRGRIYEFPDVADDAYTDGQIAKKTIADLRRLKESGKPFFLACGFMKPHMPFYAPKKYWDLYEREEIELADNRYFPKGAPKDLKGSGEYNAYHRGGFEVGTDAWHRMMRHGYYACVSYVDKLVGDVLAELDRLGLAENTIIVVWGDHGWHLGGHEFWGKHNTLQTALRVPLIVRAPGRKAGMVGAPVESVDLFPTLCELAGLKTPKTVQGRSFAVLLGDSTERFREAAYARFGNGDALMTRGFSYTRYGGGKTEMLYDLSKDPGENRNVAGDPAYAEDLKRLRSLLARRIATAAAAEERSRP